MLCEFNRNLGSNQLNGTISTFIGQLTALNYLSVTITIFSFALSLCLCSCADDSTACEIDRYLYDNQLTGTISTFIGQLTALSQLSVTISVVSFALFLCSCSCVDDCCVSFVNRQIPLRQPADGHDLDLYRTIDCAQGIVSDDYNCLVALSLFSFVW